MDVNRLGQRGETLLGSRIKEYKSRFKAFNWNVLSINGHSTKQIIKALKKSRNSKKPTIILAQTIKGKGVSFLEDKENWHGKSLTEEELKKALREIPEAKMPLIEIKKPEKKSFKINHTTPSPNNYKLDEQIATREAYGNALASLAKSNKEIISLDAEVSNSTFAEKVKFVAPEQFVEVFIQEQNLVGISLGLAAKGFIPFASTFASFLTRAHDQLRMSALSKADLTFCGSHCGVSIGEDGASQMGLEDIAMFRSIPNSIIFYPSDAVSTEKLMHLSVKLRGLKYIRTTRPKIPVLYPNSESFQLGDFKILKESTKDKAVLIGSGITLHESLKAHEELKQKGISSAVVDLYCIKPLNIKKITSFIQKHGNKIIITEDHYKEGGIGEMLSSELANTTIQISHLCINEIPHSGKKEQLLQKYKIDANAIINAAKKMLF